MSAPHPFKSRFAETHPDVLLLDPSDHAGIETYLLGSNLIAAGERPSRIESAGSGNMNLTLRVTLADRTLILKQGRPWVEKYDHIEAPWERTLIEGSFYQAVRRVPAVAGRMPELLALDERHHILALSDAGSGGDFTTMYADRQVTDAGLNDLLDWLAALGRVAITERERDHFANRAMRALNHEHIFRLPLASGNGLDLDQITQGLARAAEDLQGDVAYVARVGALGSRYLEDGASLVHGDYFPGSWIKAEDGIRIIDPEFCFLGAREFDYGVMLAHLAIARTAVEGAQRVLAAAHHEGLDESLVLNFAGTEIMRRLIGVAQLPLAHTLGDKLRLLEVSRSLLLSPEKDLGCW